jgi:hypothetical protein
MESESTLEELQCSCEEPYPILIIKKVYGDMKTVHAKTCAHFSVIKGEKIEDWNTLEKKEEEEGVKVYVFHLNEYLTDAFNELSKEDIASTKAQENQTTENGQQQQEEVVELGKGKEIVCTCKSPHPIIAIRQQGSGIKGVNLHSQDCALINKEEDIPVEMAEKQPTVSRWSVETEEPVAKRPKLIQHAPFMSLFHDLADVEVADFKEGKIKWYVKDNELTATDTAKEVFHDTLNQLCTFKNSTNKNGPPLKATKIIQEAHENGETSFEFEFKLV